MFARFFFRYRSWLMGFLGLIGALAIGYGAFIAPGLMRHADRSRTQDGVSIPNVPYECGLWGKPEGTVARPCTRQEYFAEAKMAYRTFLYLGMREYALYALPGIMGVYGYTMWLQRKANLSSSTKGSRKKVS